jgi:hypothetical protein
VLPTQCPPAASHAGRQAGGVEVLARLAASSADDPAAGDTLPTFLLHLAANASELPAGRARLQEHGGAGAAAVERLAAALQEQGGQGKGGVGDGAELAVAAATAAAAARRALGFRHWPQ